MAQPGPTLFEQYTRDLTTEDIHRLFTRDTAEAYRYFTRTADVDRIAAMPWYQRWPTRTRIVFTTFAMRLSPARRALYAISVISALFGLIMLFRGIGRARLFLFPFHITVPVPDWADGTLWLVLALVAVNLLILMEVADRLSLKSDLEIARDIQLAMLPGGVHQAADAAIFGTTRPANTVGGDFYDILSRPDGRVVIALGDVAGKGSPAALLMALLLAMLRTLVDENFESARLVTRLNAQVARHSPRSRFITLFYGVYSPADGRLEFVNAGHLPPLLRRADGRIERLGADAGGLALGMFDHATYATEQVTILPGDTLVLYSDGITEAENGAGQAFEETGLETTVALHADAEPQILARAIVAAVETYAADKRLADDLTALILKRG